MQVRDYASGGMVDPTRIAGATISANKIVANTIKISGSTALEDWRQPRVNQVVGKVQVVPGEWPSGNPATYDTHEAKGPWKEHFVLNDDHVLWKVEVPGTPKEDIVVDAIYREGELTKIRVLAPYARRPGDEAKIVNTYLDVPETGCYVSEVTLIDGVLTFEVQRGQEVTRLEID